MTSSLLEDEQPFSSSSPPTARHSSHPFLSNPSLTSHFSFLLLTHPTEVLLLSYSNRVLALITQTGKLGSMLHAHAEEGVGGERGGGGMGGEGVEVRWMLGGRGGGAGGGPGGVEGVAWVMARQVGEMVADATGGEKDVMMCVAMKAECVRDVAKETRQSLEEGGMTAARTIIAELVKHKVW